MAVLQLLCGLALFLYGMDVMGDALKKGAGSRLKTILGKMTSNPINGFLLGLGVTAIIQSSSATTVMVVGFVNSGTMTLLQSVGVIIGANLGTSVTAWITALSQIGSGENALEWIKWLKPDAWMPILAVIGIALIMFAKKQKHKYIGTILIGFSVLMVGMDLMSGSVSDLKDNAAFQSILTMFKNPILGLLAGMVLTVIVQSSSASVGILQSLTVTGGITFGAAIPIIMGQNIGTCITAILSALSANKNGKRAACIHLLFNVIGAAIWLTIFYIVTGITDFFPTDLPINAWGVAGVHTVFKLLCIATLFPFYKRLEQLSRVIIRDKKGEGEIYSILDERLLDTPAIAVARATDVTYVMADLAISCFSDSLKLYASYDEKLADRIRELEDRCDKYEDTLGSYLVKLSACDMDESDSAQITKLLHIIGDLERISDHAVNILESCDEIRDKKITFSKEAQGEIAVLSAAVGEIIRMTRSAFIDNDLTIAASVEALEEVIDELRDKIKLNHIIRLQKSECTIEHGFVLSDLLTNFERVADHCSNIAGCVVEISTYDALDMHKYTSDVKHGADGFNEKFKEFSEKYKIAK